MSDIIDFKLEQRRRQNQKAIEINRKQPGLLTDYRLKRDIVTQEIQKIKNVTIEFEKTQLCFSNEKRIPPIILNAYINQKALLLHLEIILASLDASVRKQYPDFDPNKLT